MSSPAIFGVVAMGAVFGAAAQAPLTAIASVVEMTGNFTLILPVMLATAIAAALSKQLSYGSIYTTKLLRRGIDIERPKPSNVLTLLTVADVMRPLVGADGRPVLLDHRTGATPDGPGEENLWENAPGTVTDIGPPQGLLADEVLSQALRQLALYGRDGLPVLDADGRHLRGWVTRRDVLSALAKRVSSEPGEAEAETRATELGASSAGVHLPTSPLEGYDVVEVTIGASSPALGARLGQVVWPPGCIVVAVTEGRDVISPRPDIELRVGERVVLLAPARHPRTSDARPTTEP